jgi:hypothetical protein
MHLHLSFDTGGSPHSFRNNRQIIPSPPRAFKLFKIFPRASLTNPSQESIPLEIFLVATIPPSADPPPSRSSEAFLNFSGTFPILKKRLGDDGRRIGCDDHVVAAAVVVAGLGKRGQEGRGDFAGGVM